MAPFELPPLTTEAIPEAVFEAPPVTVEAVPEEVLPYPPPIIELMPDEALGLVAPVDEIPPPTITEPVPKFYEIITNTYEYYIKSSINNNNIINEKWLYVTTLPTFHINKGK